MDTSMQHPGTRRYQLGLYFLKASNLILERMDLRPVTRPHLLTFRDATGETVHFTVLDGEMGVNVDVAESQQTTRVASTVGSRDELHSSAVGQALLAFSPAHPPEGDSRAARAPGPPPSTITEPTVFRPHLAEVRRKGYAVEDEEGEFGARSLGAPVIDHTGAVVASISVAAQV
jgi:IclR family KDG regulon transcriptional repressor